MRKAIWKPRKATYRPGAQQINQEIAAESGGEHLGDDVEVGDQSGLQDDGDVGGVEQLDGVGVLLPAVTSRLDGQVHPEALRFTRVCSANRDSTNAPLRSSKAQTPHLEVYDDSKDEHRGDQVHEVGQVLPVEGFPQSSHFVRPSGQKMEESDDGSLEFCAWGG